MLHLDLPSLSDIRALAARRGDACVSIYLPTTPLTRDVGASRIEFGNLCKSALQQLDDAGFDKRRLALVADQLEDLQQDDGFWRLQANSLAVLVDPEHIRAFRLPNRLSPLSEVADRFHLKPLVRAVTFPHRAFVLALAENAVRLIDVPAEGSPAKIKVPGLPKSAADATRRASVNDRSPSGRIHGSEGQKVLLRIYARKVDEALRGALAGRDAPLILAAAEPLASIYRSVCSHPHLAARSIAGAPDGLKDAELATAVRPILDDMHRAHLAAFRALYEKRSGQGRATADIAVAARAATYGMIDQILVDMDSVTPGTVEDDTGAVTFADGPSASTYGVGDEIACRALLSGARVFSVRAEDIPGGAALAAILRYPLAQAQASV
jgi:hypothetical protein